MECSLIFFDTFSHESSASQLDLVQFQHPVQVSEIRIIPLGARVQADFPGGVRLGATNPSQFQIEFFVNDLSKRGAATFENIGSLQYSQHGEIKLDLGKKLPTDGLLLRGKYNTITLAVYGKLAKVYQDSPPKTQIDPPQPPPEKVNTHERIRDWLENTKHKQPGYETCVPEESDWDAKVPRSPDRPWDELVDGKADNEKRTDKQSMPREINKLKASHERSSNSREKSWDLSEKSYRKGKKENMSKSMERELSKDREMIMKIKDGEQQDNDEVIDSSDREWGSDLGRGKNTDYDKERTFKRDLYEDEFDIPKKRKIIDEWEHRSDTSNHSMRRPRTPQEIDKTLSDPRIARSPYPCNDDVPRKDWEDKDWDRASREKEDDRDRGNEPFRNWSRSRSRDKDRGRSTPKSPEHVPIPPPILSDEMEAISDDEELLNLPVDPVDGDYPAEDNMEGSINDDNEAFEYEDIMSDEEELSGYQYDDEYVVEEWEDHLKQLSTQELLAVTKLQHFHPASSTEYEALMYSSNICGDNEKLTCDKCALSTKLVCLTKETIFPFRLREEMEDPDTAADMSIIEAEEMWVQAVEYASQLLPEALVHVDDKQETLAILYNWVDNGLNFDLAMNQLQPLYKIRHIKAGVKLTVSLLQCNGNIAVDLLNQGIFDKLMELFAKECMAVSLKLLILRAIDSIALNIEGILYITNQTEGKNGYERILELFSSSQQSRVKVSLSSVVRKVHFYEVCDKFREDVTNLAVILQRQCEQQEYSDFQVAKRLDDQSLTLLTSAESCLKEIVRCFLFADHLMTQSIRWLPGSKPFQLPKSDSDPFPPIYRILNETKTLEAISVLLASSQLINNASILTLVKTLLEYMLSVEHGIVYLIWKGITSSNIIKSLLQFEKEYHENDSRSLFQHLGLKLAYSIQIAKQLDSLAHLTTGQLPNKSRQETKLTDSTFEMACTHLNILQSILLSSVGKEILIHILTLPKFTRILFPFLNMDPACDLEEKPAAAACYGYVVELLVTSVKLNPTGHFLETCSAPLTELIDGKDSHLKVEDYTKLRTLLTYLSVAKAENFSYDNLSSLINTVQDGIERLEQFPGELFSALQILQYLTIPGKCLSAIDADHCTDELVEELRFKYATVQLYSNDLHIHLSHLLSKLCTMNGLALQHRANFASTEGKMVLLLIKPSVILLKNLLGSVIEARNTDFKDLTVLNPILHAYLLLEMFPLGSSSYSEAQCTQGVIISIILLFTQPVYRKEGEEMLAKSLWTLMMSEIFKMLLSSPRNIVGILKLVINLLPLPLPIQSYSKLTDEETMQAVRLRKLWSAHLYILSGTLHDIIVRLGVGSHPALTHSLRKMCVAVADLSAPMALLVARSTLDLVMQSHRLDQKNTPREEKQLMSAQTRRVLSSLGSLVSHAPIKMAVVHLLRGGGASLAVPQCKSEEKYPSLVTTWCKILTIASNVEIHLASQKALLVVVYNLFNQEICMSQQSDQKNIDLSGVPHKELLIPLLEAVVDTLRISLSPDTSYMALSILILLLNHNYGFNYVKSTLDKRKCCLYPVLSMLCSHMKTNFEDYFYLLQTLVTFCYEMLHPDEGRTYVVTPSDLATYLNWKSGLEDLLAAIIPSDDHQVPLETSEKTPEEDTYTNRLEKALLKMEDIHLKNIHPLLQLQKFVVENGQEDETSEFIYEDIKYLIKFLESESITGESPNLECIDHTIESLQTQFASRITWIIPSCEEDQSTWFLPPLMDNIDQSDMVKVNLLEICRKYTDDYDLAGGVLKVSKGLNFQSLSPQKITKAIPKYKPSSSAIRPDRKGKPYVAPMRGRNFGRGNIRNDPFRSRPPNTSRPPSLHVDDFVALESTGHQPTGPTGYNKISFGRGKMMLDSMRGGRGRQRGMNDSRGNRFFHRTPFRAIRSRSQGWGYRGDGSRGNYRGSTGASGHFMRGRMPSGNFRGRGMSTNTKERFSMKYIDRGRRKYS